MIVYTLISPNLFHPLSYRFTTASSLNPASPKATLTHGPQPAAAAAAAEVGAAAGTAFTGRKSELPSGGAEIDSDNVGAFAGATAGGLLLYLLWLLRFGRLGGDAVVVGVGEVASVAEGRTSTSSFMPAVQWPGTPQMK